MLCPGKQDSYNFLVLIGNQCCLPKVTQVCSEFTPKTSTGNHGTSHTSGAIITDLVGRDFWHLLLPSSFFLGFLFGGPLVLHSTTHQKGQETPEVLQMTFYYSKRVSEDRMLGPTKLLWYILQPDTTVPCIRGSLSP